MFIPPNHCCRLTDFQSGLPVSTEKGSLEAFAGLARARVFALGNAPCASTPAVARLTQVSAEIARSPQKLTAVLETTQGQLETNYVSVDNCRVVRGASVSVAVSSVGAASGRRQPQVFASTRAAQHHLLAAVA